MSSPYLSVVVTARNDNHGGNMLRRMQIFVNGLLYQCQRYSVEAELIVVEWNPLPDKPSLAEALCWEIADSPCAVRFIEVPPQLHAQLRYAESLPLFQMIAKNVGIRRAKGEFILAANIDLLFSDELFEFLATHSLEVGKFYRMSRYDVAADVPMAAPIKEQLAYCEQNLLRINHACWIEHVSQPEPEPLVSEPIMPSESELSQTHPAPQPANAILPLLRGLKQVYRRSLPTGTRDAILRMLPPHLVSWCVNHGLLAAQQAAIVPVADELTHRVEAAPPAPSPWQYPLLHTNACGDFTLMSKLDWFKVRAYPEWEIFSMHLDSILLYLAHYAGIEQVVLEDPMRTYHIEHGSGWTPEAERNQTLNRRLEAKGIPQFTMDEFAAIVTLMQKTGKPLISNDQSWGMADEVLPEKNVNLRTLATL